MDSLVQVDCANLQAKLLHSAQIMEGGAERMSVIKYIAYALHVLFADCGMQKPQLLT